MTEDEFQPPSRYADTIIFPASLDPDAVNIVRRLNEAGLESYLVGGCVRDLLLGLIPKDFDISTEARPRQIRRLFRNSRIIGRRFKLAHIQFGSKIIEVATFRRTPDGGGDGGNGPPAVGDAPPDLLITRDNEFGNAREDVLRRDFTINALLYDVRTAEVIDHVGGVQDLSARTLRTIGDPVIRFAEDPVRMLRAIKFCARLGLVLDPQVEAAMHASADLIRKSAPPRVIEEIFKLLTCGAAGRALPLLLQFGLLERLLPELGASWRERPEELAATGSALDVVDRGRRRVSNAFLLAALVLRPWLERVRAEPQTDPLIWTHDLLDAAAQRTSIPRRDTASAKYQLLAVLRLERPRRGRRSRGGDLLSRGMAETMELLHVGALSGAVDPELHAHWAQAVAEARAAQLAGRAQDEAHDPEANGGVPDEGVEQDAEFHAGSPELDRDPGRRRRRRGGRGRRRGRSGRRDEGPSTDQQATDGASTGDGEAGFAADRCVSDPGDDQASAHPDDSANTDHSGADRDGATDPGAAPSGPPRRRRGRRGGRRRRRGGDRDDTPGRHANGQDRQPAAEDATGDGGAPGTGPASGDPHEADDQPAHRGTESRPATRERAPASQSGGQAGPRNSRRRDRNRGGHKRQPSQNPGAGERSAPQPAGKGRERRGPRRPEGGGPPQGPTQGPGQRHPEDVEDFFDW